MGRRRGKMGAPSASRRVERPRDWVGEAFLLAKEANIPDPLSMSIVEFNAMLEQVARGELRRLPSGPMDARAYVDSYSQRF